MFLSPILLVSCKNETSDFYVESNPFQFARNGDLFLADFDNGGYSNLGVVESVTSTVASSMLGESFNILLVSNTCHACQEFETSFASFLKDTFLDVIIYSKNNTETTPYANALLTHFGEDKIENSDDYPFLKITPTWYSGNETEGMKILNWGYSNKKDLTRNLLKQSSITNLYKFSSVDALKKGLEDEDSLIYLLDSKNEKSLSFYKDFLYKKAIKSKKRAYIFVTERATSAENEKALEYFGDYSLIIGNKKESLDNEGSLKSLINSYYE